MKDTRSTQKGFVILLAIVISASILVIGAGIFSSAFKETILASASTESQVAIFVADTGMECALYGEFVQGGEPLSKCGGDVMERHDVAPVSNLNPALSSYELYYRIDGTPTCGHISIQRNRRQDGSLGGAGTSIISRGYNFCNGTNPDTSNPTLVERRLEVWYPNADPNAPTTESTELEASGG
ncbi:hypothetical protein H6776_00955 [Candidatus Nomurabacteria bacterium]|nr:hypothetical protein [Candidatus Nomurabacteria bacterium]